MDCPQGIDIPKVLAIYNNYLFGKARNRPITSLLFTMEYRILGEEKQAYHCVQCNQCSGKCPQHIDIPHWMIMIIEIHQALLPKK
jgi:predicted aldo/keto reductase-like oxidoreductase